MFVRVKKSATRNVNAVQLVEGIRDPITNKVKQRVVRHIGSASDQEEITKLIELAEFIKVEITSSTQPNLIPDKDIVSMAMSSRQRCEKEQIQPQPIDDISNLRSQGSTIIGIHEVYGKIYDQLGFNKILPNPAREVSSINIILNVVLARIANPTSKRETVNLLVNNYGVDLKLDSVYKTMDKIDDKVVEKIEQCALLSTQKLFKEKIDVLFYDATTLYFESFTEDELKSKGFSKDHKFNEVQVMLSIFVTNNGIPIGYEIFPGATYEGHTLLKALDSLKGRFAIDKVVFVADSGMLNNENLALLEQAGYQYIVGAKIKNMTKDITAKILNSDDYQPLTVDAEEYKGKIIELPDKGRKLIMSYSSKRAYKDAQDREQALKKLMKKMNRSKGVKSLISASGYKKYLMINNNDKFAVNEQKIEEDSKWDGLHGVISNLENVDVAYILSRYKGLWQIEETFRVSKHDIKIRPIYHWSPSRIKAHIALCFMALVCIRHLEYRVNLQSIKLSPERLRKALIGVGITSVVHIKDKRVFGIPSPVSDEAKIIYKAMNLPISTIPYLISSGE